MSPAPRVLLVALLASLAGCGGEAVPPESRAPTLAERLRQGGYTLVVRHARADAEVGFRERLRSCSLQRNLTVAGRAQAESIGAGIRRLRVPVGEVRTSPMCRARDTARLAFGRALDDRALVSPGVIGSQRDDERRVARLRDAAGEPPPAGRNTVLVTHIGLIGKAFGDETLPEGGTLVVGPGAEVVGRVEAEEWAALGGG